MDSKRNDEGYALGTDAASTKAVSDPYYQTKKHKEWRAKVLRRDNYQCQECKRYGILREGTIAHHVKPREDYPELQYDVANGRTLCAKHHNKEHPEKGTKALKSRRRL